LNSEGLNWILKIAANIWTNEHRQQKNVWDFVMDLIPPCSKYFPMINYRICSNSFKYKTQKKFFSGCPKERIPPVMKRVSTLVCEVLLSGQWKTFTDQYFSKSYFQVLSKEFGFICTISSIWSTFISNCLIIMEPSSLQSSNY
jgi:hypothetical protein